MYQPKFQITPSLIALIEEIAALRQKIIESTIQASWIPALQKETAIRNAHSSTAIEGNPLTLEQVRALEEGRPLAATTERAQREVLNYFAGLRFIQKHPAKKIITHEDVLKLHAIVSSGVMNQGEAGQYRKIQVRVGRYFPPSPELVSGLMSELLEWWNRESGNWSAVLTSSIIHYRFEENHPFADGNGRTGRTLALWELYRRGFDTQHIFSVDEFYWENRPSYYEALDSVRKKDGHLTGWLEYACHGLRVTLEKVWMRVQQLSARMGSQKIALTPKQERFLLLLRDHGSLSPREIWKGIGVSKQGAINLLKPLLKAGLIQRIGTKKSGRYVLR